jgi:multiple sugar transport system substrate-binding protein
MPVLKKYYDDPALLSAWVGPNDAHPEGFRTAVLDMFQKHSHPAMVYYVKNSAKIDAMVNNALDPVWMGRQTAADAMKALAPVIAPEILGRYGGA